MRRTLALIPLLAALLLAGCGDDPVLPGATASTAQPARPAAAKPRRAPAPPAICRPLGARVLGEVGSPGASEISGLALSHRRAGLLWAHNDSGDAPRVLGFGLDGTPVADVAITGAQAIDWEDMAVGPGGALYLGDIGDNQRVRETVDVHRVPEPAAGATVSAPATRFSLRYPDGAHDAESLLVDPRTGELAIVTKDLGGSSRVYVARRPSASRTVTLRHVTTLELGLGGLATGGSVSADGRTIAVRTYTGLVAWSRRSSATLAATLRRRPCSNPRVDLADEGQGESVALSHNGRVLFTVAEGERPPVRRYAPR